MSEANKTVIRRAIECMNKHDLSFLTELYPECTYHSPATGDLKGEAFRKFFTNIMNSFPDLRITVEDQIADGEMVMTRYVFTGTHKGDFMGIVPTGKRVSVEGIVLDRIVNGKVIAEWDHWDALGMMRQLGVVPEIKLAEPVAA